MAEYVCADLSERPGCKVSPFWERRERVVCPRCHVSTRREYQSWRVGYGDDDITRTLAIGRAISLWNRREGGDCQ